MNNIIFEIKLDDMTIQIEECGRVQRFDKSGTLITTGKCLVINKIPQLIQKYLDNSLCDFNAAK